MEILKVYGPPGCGKTTRMLQIMEMELARGVAPDRLAYLSFTVRARKEAKQRALEKFPHLTEDDLPYFRTLHAICYHELNMTSGGMVKGPDDMKELAEMLGIQFTYKPTRGGGDLMLEMPYGGEAGDRMLQIDHVRRHRMQTLEDGWHNQFDDAVNIWQVRRFVSEYDRWKHREGLRDFTDLLEEAQTPLDIDVVIVDEAQDLSVLQWHTLHRLAVKAERMYIAGDDDQAIFTWAGADPIALLNHPGKVEVLEQSYRVPRAVHRIADSLSGKIKIRQPKAWKPRDVEGSVRHLGENALPSFEEDGSYFIMYRQHYLVKEMEAHVRTLGLSYSRSDQQAPGAEWGNAIIAWEQLRKGKKVPWTYVNQAIKGMLHSLEADGVKQFRRLTRTDAYDMAQLTELTGLTETRPWYEALDRIMPKDRTYLRAMIRRNGSKALTGESKIHLSTIHATKGAERDHVVLLTQTSPRVREVMMTDPDVERRVFYVGCTRAKQSLTLIGLDNPLL